MANYVVTTRGKDGSLVERAYTADDRADLFKKLSADGVNAVRVREGTLGKKPRKSAASGAPSKGRGLIAAAIVILGLGAAVWYLMPGGEKPVAKKQVPKVEKKIAGEAASKTALKKSDSKKMSVSTNDAAKEVKKPKLTRSQLRDLRNGRHFYPPARTSRVVRVSREASLFQSPSDQWLAVALTVEPGTPMLMDPDSIFNDRFKKRFAESFAAKIEINETDDDYDKKLKQMVIDTKKELAQRVKAGEDICDIMKSTFKELKQLALYKQEIEKLVKDSIKDEKTTDQDCEEILQAANKMLEDRGIGKMKMPSIYRKKIRLMQMRKADQK